MWFGHSGRRQVACRLGFLVAGVPPDQHRGADVAGEGEPLGGVLSDRQCHDHHSRPDR